MNLSARIRLLGWNLTELECEDPRTGEMVCVVTACQGEKRISSMAQNYDEALAVVAAELATLGYNCRIPLYRARNNRIPEWIHYFPIAVVIQFALTAASSGCLDMFTRLHNHIASPFIPGFLNSLPSIHAGILGEAVLLTITLVFPGSIASSEAILTITSLAILLTQSILFTLAHFWKREMFLYWTSIILGIFCLNSGPTILGAAIVIFIS